MMTFALCLVAVLVVPVADASRDAVLSAAQARLIQYVEAGPAPAVSAAVFASGALAFAGAAGFADVEQQVTASVETRFRIGSVSKPITAALVARLVEQGKLDPDAVVQTYVPDFPVKDYPITTRQLGGHLAGIRHYRGAEFLSARPYATVADALEIFADDPLLHPPGSTFFYSSYGFNLISGACEGAGKAPFLDLLEREVFDPLALDATTADDPRRIVAHRARFYDTQLGRLAHAPYVDLSNKWAGGGLLSTPSDLVRFGAAHFAPGPFLSAESHKLLFTPQRTSDGRSTNYGFGWRVVTGKGGELRYEHSGGSVGGRAMLIVWPKVGVAVAALANHTDARDLAGLARELATPFID